MDARNRTSKGNLYIALFYLEKRATKTYHFNHYQEHAIRDSKNKLSIYLRLKPSPQLETALYSSY